MSLEEDQWFKVVFDQAVKDHGMKAAREIAHLYDRVWIRLPPKRAWAWALDKWHEKENARLAGTGYDPDEQYRHLL